MAVAVGANKERYRASLPAAKERVDADERILKGLPFPGPHFYVNGRSGNVRFSCDTKGTIAEELRRGKEAVTKGASPNNVYADRVRVNVARKAHCVELKD